MRAIVTAMALAIGAPAVAQTSVPAPAPTAPAATADPQLLARIGELVAILDGRGDYDRFFAAAVKQALPKPQFDAVTAQLKQGYGAPKAVAETRALNPTTAMVNVAYERGTVTFAIAVDGSGAVVGLRVLGTAVAETPNDSAEKLAADFRALPGQAGFGIYDLAGDAPKSLGEWRGGDAAPLGSAFKLWILAETVRQVQAGTRRWADVTLLTRPSLPSGITQAWPPATPMTLQSLATLMISISDNTATDTLLSAIGRDAVGKMAGDSGAAASSLPVLSAREAFVLKSDPARAAAWGKADAAARAKMLADPKLWNGPINPTVLAAGKPAAIDSVEWFASPASVARTLARLRGDETALAILSVNKAVDPGTAAKFAYLGFKGGSEPGVVTLNFLVRTKSGAWRAVVGNWRRSDADTPTLTLMTLMTRALVLASH